MHKHGGLADLRESVELSPSLKKERKEKKHYLGFPWEIQRSLSFRAIENAPNRDQDNIALARTEVFATTELVYEILSHIPVERLASARRVSKEWNTVVRKLGYYIDPVRVHTKSPNCPYSYPEYSDTVTIICNPLFGRYKKPKPAKPSREHYAIHFQIDTLFVGAAMRKHGHQFLTNPPITQLALSVFPVVPGGANSMLKVRDGIRLRDLAEALDAFCKLNRGSDAGVLRKFMFTVADLSQKDYEKCNGYTVGAHLSCVKGESQRVYLFNRGLGMRQRKKRNE